MNISNCFPFSLDLHPDLVAASNVKLDHYSIKGEHIYYAESCHVYTNGSHWTEVIDPAPRAMGGANSMCNMYLNIKPW